MNYAFQERKLAFIVKKNSEFSELHFVVTSVSMVIQEFLWVPFQRSSVTDITVQFLLLEKETQIVKE